MVVKNVTFVIVTRRSNTFFFYCHHAKILWRVVAVATGLPPPSSVVHMSSTWLLDIDAKQRKLILVGVAALCCVIWHCWNDIYFNNDKYTSFMQALFRGAYWLRFWALLQPTGTHELLRSVSKNLETTTLEQFSRFGWKFNIRLCSQQFYLFAPLMSVGRLTFYVIRIKYWLGAFAEAGTGFHYLKKR